MIEGSVDTFKSLDLIFHEVHDHGVDIADLWIKEVERKSSGKVRIKKYTGGGPAITKIADIIRDVPAESPRYRLLNLVQIPFIFPSASVGTRVIAQLYNEFAELRDELSDFKILGLGIGAPMAIFTTRSWGPVRSLENLKGARIRSLTPIDQAITALGAIPLHVNYQEIGPSLADGRLDATVLGLLPARMFRLAEGAAPYCTLTGRYSITMHPMRIFMKWDSWQRLPLDVQDVIESLGPVGSECWYARTSGADSDRHFEEALSYFHSKGEIITLDPGEFQRWQTAVRPAQEVAIEEVEKQGLPGRKFFNRMRELAQALDNLYGQFD